MPALPDWLRGVVLLGKYNDEYVVLAVDENGQLTVLAVGEDPGGTQRALRTDSDGQLIMIPRGQGGNYLDVDSDGYLTTVVKGNYDGNLVTVECDSSGRLSAFIIDSTDAWGQLLSVGNAELAYRLGSPARGDETGYVEMMENFDQGITHWDLATSGTAAAAELDPEIFKSGGYSMYLRGGSDGSRLASMTYYISALPSGKLGLAFSVAFGTALESLQALLYIYTGSTLHRTGAKIDTYNGQISLLTGVSTWTLAESINNNFLSTKQFDRFKFTVDLNTGAYGNLWLQGLSYDETGHSYSTSASSVSPGYYISVLAYSFTGTNGYVNIDDLVFTVAEP